MATTSNKTIAKNAGFLYLRMLVVIAVTFFTARIILQSLGETDYGVYNVVGGIVTMMVFLNGALGASTSRFLTYHLGRGDKKSLKDTFAATLNLHLCIALLVILLGETLGLWFFYEKLNIPEDRVNAAFWVYQFSIVTTCINFTQVPYNASIISHEKMSIYAYVGLYDALSKLVIAYLIFISPWDRLIFYAFLLMFNTLLIQGFYRFYTHKRYEECRFRIIYDKKLYIQLLSYGGWDMFGSIATVAQSQGINIVLNMFFGPSVNAARAIAVQIQSGVTSFVQNVLVAFRPQVIKNFAIGNTLEMYNLTFRASKISFLLMLAMTLPICFEMDFVLELWLGESCPSHTAIFAIIMLINIQLEVIHSAYLMCYHAIGEIKLGNSICGSFMILALPISWFVLKMGAPSESVFIIILVINFVCQLLGWVIVHKYVHYSYWTLIKNVYLPCFVISVLALIVPTVIVHSMHPSWGRFLIVLIAGDAMLIILSWLIALTANERKLVLQLIKRKIHR